MARNKINTIYILKNKKNRKVYIGQTWHNLKGRSKNGGIGYKQCVYLWKAICKWGWDNFYYEILEFCSIQEMANYLEASYIKEYKSNDPRFGYNLSSGGSNGFHSEATKQKISKSNKGKIMIISEETKRKMSASHSGVSQSQAHRESISKSKLGEKNPNFGGKLVYDTTRIKMSNNTKGENNPSAKLTKLIVEEIRKEYVDGNITQAKLSEKYGVAITTISALLAYKSWKK